MRNTHKSPQIALVAATSVLLALSTIHADYLRDQPIQHLPTVVALAVLVWAASKGVMSDASLVCIVVFIFLHIVGARYIYSFVPYDDWSQRLWGASITDTFHFSRNHYDRLVHFSYGFLAMPPQVELVERLYNLGRRAAILISFALVMAASALYEILEWTVAIILAPDWADRYNGQQGDLWDSQKDMACAAIGAIVMGAILIVARHRSGTK